MPLPQTGVRCGQPVLARIKEIAQDAVEVEIHEPRPLVQEKWPVQEHFLERHQPLFELRQQLLLLRPPLVEAAAPELAFLVPEEGKLVRRRHYLASVNVVELEADAFDLVLDVTPDKGLHALQFPREQPKLKLGVEVLGDYLRILVHLEDDRFAVPNDGHAVIALPGQSPDQRAVAVGNVGDLESSAGELEDAPLDDAK